MPVGVLVLVETRVVYANRRLLDITGYDRGELVDVDLARIVHHDDLPAVRDRIQDPLACQPALPAATLRYVRKNGQVRWMDAAAMRIEWDGRPALMSFVYDVTEQKAIEERLAQSNKMDAIGRLAGGVAHDFSNVLQVILACCAQLREDTAEAFRQDIAVIEEATRKAAALTKQLLTFSRKHVSRRRVLDVADVVRQQERLLQRVLGEDIRLVVRVPSHPACVRVDEGQIQQVIMNLAINARDAMAHGGTLTLAARECGREVELSVTDTGAGMDEETRSHLFEPFFTTKEEGRGTGLGLSIVYGIVKQNGGRIQVESAAGVGSQFTVIMPRVDPDVVEAVVPARHEGRAGSATILVIEDEDVVRDVVRRILSRVGYGVVEAESGSRAIEICGSSRFDLLLTDLVMPGMSGAEAAAHIRRLHPSTKVMYMTGYPTAEVARLAAESPIIHKPFEPSELLARVKQVIDG